MFYDIYVYVFCWLTDRPKNYSVRNLSQPNLKEKVYFNIPKYNSSKKYSLSIAFLESESSKLSLVGLDQRIIYWMLIGK